MPTTRETILAAPLARLSALPVTGLRGDVLPERTPATGLIILRVGKPGEPEVTHLPLTYFYERRAELGVVSMIGATPVRPTVNRESRQLGQAQRPAPRFFQELTSHLRSGIFQQRNKP